MRTKIQLLLMLINYIRQDDDFYGMCVSLCDMRGTIIDYDEYYFLQVYLKKHKPLRARLRSFFGSDTTYQFWWKKGIKEPRLHWLSHRVQIEIRKQKLKNLFK